MAWEVIVHRNSGRDIEQTFSTDDELEMLARVTRWALYSEEGDSIHIEKKSEVSPDV